MKSALLSLAAATLCASQSLAADLITKTSPHSVPVTMDRLETAVTKAGATVFARVDHAKGAASVDMALAPMQVLIFGNPKLGTPVLQDGPTAGLDLPLRVLVHERADGTVQVSYHDPMTLSESHAVSADNPALERMVGALGKLTDASIAQD